MLRLSFFFLIVTCGHLATAARILLYNPLFAQSHVNFMTNIAEILLEEGHDVVRFFVSAIPADGPGSTGKYSDSI